MNAPGPIDDIKEILHLEIKHGWFDRYYELTNKWDNFAMHTIKKYDLSSRYWFIWCKWYLKREKCKEILRRS